MLWEETEDDWKGAVRESNAIAKVCAGNVRFPWEQLKGATSASRVRRDGEIKRAPLLRARAHQFG
jgi:hypothetical protein